MNYWQWYTLRTVSLRMQLLNIGEECVFVCVPTKTILQIWLHTCMHACTHAHAHMHAHRHIKLKTIIKTLKTLPHSDINDIIITILFEPPLATFYVFHITLIITKLALFRIIFLIHFEH